MSTAISLLAKNIDFYSNAARDVFEGLGRILDADRKNRKE
jgi:hypothetical protein